MAALSRMDVQRVGFKFFVERADGIELPEFIPIFHRWIQTHAVDGLLIDVADYSHVHHGPGIMLVAHEGNYAVDLARGRMGLLYYRKQPAEGELAQRLLSICRIVLRACRQLEQAPELDRRIQFRGEELMLVANDRLLAPNTEETLAALQPALSALMTRLYDRADCTLTREPDPREPFSVTVKAPQPVAIGMLLQRLGD